MRYTHPRNQARQSSTSHKQPLQKWLAVVVIIGLTGCSTPSIVDYQDGTPAFEPENFFDGKLTAHGVVKDYSGKAIRHFNADIIACWDDGVGTLDESFVFDDGERALLGRLVQHAELRRCNVHGIVRNVLSALALLLPILDHTDGHWLARLASSNQVLVDLSGGGALGFELDGEILAVKVRRASVVFEGYRLA